jgi:hypothetical protein
MSFGPKGAFLALTVCLLLGAVGLLFGARLVGHAQQDVWYGYYYDDLRQNADGALSRPYTSAQECRAAMQDYTLESKVTAGFACARGCDTPRDGVIANCAQVVR